MCKIIQLFLISIILCSCAVVPQELPKLYKKNVSAIVSIFVGEKEGTCGSGFIVDKQKGLIITAAHIVGYNESCQIIFWSGLKISGIVLIIDELNDIAIIKVNKKYLKNNLIPNLKFELNPTIGEQVYCIGNPGGYVGTISLGVLSTNLIVETDLISLRPNKYYLSDIHIFGGSSGCPVFNLENKIIGMVVQYRQSYALMIPAKAIDKLLKENASN